MQLVKLINKSKFKLTIGKIYEVESELFDLETMETYAIEIHDDNGDFIELPIKYFEVIE